MKKDIARADRRVLFISQAVCQDFDDPFFVNGMRIRGLPSEKIFEKVIAAELKRIEK